MSISSGTILKCFNNICFITTLSVQSHLTFRFAYSIFDADLKSSSKLQFDKLKFAESKQQLQSDLSNLQEKLTEWNRKPRDEESAETMLADYQVWRFFKNSVFSLPARRKTKFLKQEKKTNTGVIVDPLRNCRPP